MKPIFLNRQTITQTSYHASINVKVAVVKKIRHFQSNTEFFAITEMKNPETVWKNIHNLFTVAVIKKMVYNRTNNEYDEKFYRTWRDTVTPISNKLSDRQWCNRLKQRHVKASEGGRVHISNLTIFLPETFQPQHTQIVFYECS